MKLTYMPKSDAPWSICSYYRLLAMVTHNIYDREIEDAIWEVQPLYCPMKISLDRSDVNKGKNRHGCPIYLVMSITSTGIKLRSRVVARLYFEVDTFSSDELWKLCP